VKKNKFGGAKTIKIIKFSGKINFFFFLRTFCFFCFGETPRVAPPLHTQYVVVYFSYFNSFFRIGNYYLS
jgi:hypothetical protein